MVSLFEKKAIRVDYVDSSINEGSLKNIALATMMGASALSGFAGGKGDKGNINPDDKKHIEVKSKKIADNYVKLGWTLENTSVLNLIDEIVEDSVAEMVKYELDLSNSFESGRFILDTKSKDSIANMFNSIMADGANVSKIAIESSTDKTPISARMKEETGIMNNTQLSQKRSESIIDHLKSNNFLSASNVDSVEVNNLVEQGGKDDPTARYVKLVVFTVKKVANEDAGTTYKTDTTYHLSKEKTPGIPFGDRVAHKKTIKHFTKKNVDKLKSIACPNY
jgi:hypothetical protein